MKTMMHRPFQAVPPVPLWISVMHQKAVSREEKFSFDIETGFIGDEENHCAVLRTSATLRTNRIFGVWFHGYWHEYTNSGVSKEHQEKIMEHISKMKKFRYLEDGKQYLILISK